MKKTTFSLVALNDELKKKGKLVNLNNLSLKLTVAQQVKQVTSQLTPFGRISYCYCSDYSTTVFMTR